MEAATRPTARGTPLAGQKSTWHQYRAVHRRVLSDSHPGSCHCPPPPRLAAWSKPLTVFCLDWCGSCYLGWARFLRHLTSALAPHGSLRGRECEAGPSWLRRCGPPLPRRPAGSPPQPRALAISPLPSPAQLSPATLAPWPLCCFLQLSVPVLLVPDHLPLCAVFSVPLVPTRSSACLSPCCLSPGGWAPCLHV